MIDEFLQADRGREPQLVVMEEMSLSYLLGGAAKSGFVRLRDRERQGKGKT